MTPQLQKVLDDCEKSYIKYRRQVIKCRQQLKVEYPKGIAVTVNAPHLKAVCIVTDYTWDYPMQLCVSDEWFTYQVDLRYVTKSKL